MGRFPITLQALIALVSNFEKFVNGRIGRASSAAKSMTISDIIDAGAPPEIELEVRAMSYLTTPASRQGTLFETPPLECFSG